MSDNLELHFPTVNIFHHEIENKRNFHMINFLIFHSLGNCPECDYSRQIPAIQFRSTHTIFYNRHKWGLINLFIIILFMMQGFYNLVLSNGNDQLSTSDKIFCIDKSSCGSYTKWMGREIRCMSSPISRISQIKTALNTLHPRLAFYQNEFLLANQNTYSI